MARLDNVAVLTHPLTTDREGAGATQDLAEQLSTVRLEPAVQPVDLTADIGITIASGPLPGEVSPAFVVDAAPATDSSTEPRSWGDRHRFRSWSGRYVRDAVALDTLVGAVGVLGAGVVARLTSLGTVPTPGWLLAGLVAWPAAIAVMRGYERARVGIGGDEMRALLRAAVLVLAVTAVPAGLLVQQRVLTMVVVALPIVVVGSLAVRFATRKRLHAQQRQGHNVRKVVVVGSVAATEDLSRILQQEKHCGMQVVGVCVPSVDVRDAQDRGLRVVGDLEQVPSAIREFDCDAVAVTSGDATRHNFLRELSWALEGTPVELLVHPGLIEVAGPRMHIRPFVGLPLLYVEQPHFTGWRRLVKRGTDITLAGLFVVLLAPVFAAIAVAIKLQDGGPVIFRQTRIGTAGRSFTMLKFRSMVTDAEARRGALLAHNEGAGPLFKMRHDPRITRLGRFLRDFSLDELPQLFNVLGGSMSLVGPRPQLEAEVELLQSDARRRLLVTPGVTGLWQVSGRSNLAWDESVRLDLRYVENWSLVMDLHILWRTIRAVLQREGSR